MPYNNYFPASYQPVFPQYQQYQQPQSNSGLVWVQGENAAKAYPVAQNTSVLLMDSESSVFYIKSSDASGMPLPLRIFDYKERTQAIPKEEPAEPQIDMGNYITREEFESRIAQLAPVKQPAKKGNANGQPTV